MSDSETKKLSYYQLNKDKVKAMLFKKETCPFCHRQVTHQNMNKHKKSKLCQNNRTNVVQPTNDILDMVKSLKEQIQQLQLQQKA